MNKFQLFEISKVYLPYDNYTIAELYNEIIKSYNPALIPSIETFRRYFREVCAQSIIVKQQATENEIKRDKKTTAYRTCFLLFFLNEITKQINQYMITIAKKFNLQKEAEQAVKDYQSYRSQKENEYQQMINIQKQINKLDPQIQIEFNKKIFENKKLNSQEKLAQLKHELVQKSICDKLFVQYVTQFRTEYLYLITINHDYQNKFINDPAIKRDLKYAFMKNYLNKDGSYNFAKNMSLEEYIWLHRLDSVKNYLVNKNI